MNEPENALPLGIRGSLPDRPDGTPGPSVYLVREGKRDRDGFPSSVVLDARGGWLGSQRVRLHVEIRDGAPRCTSVTVDGTASVSGVTTAALRNVTVDALLRAGLSLALRQVTPINDTGSVRVEFPVVAQEQAATRARHAVTRERLDEFVASWRKHRKAPPHGGLVEAVGHDLHVERSQVYRLRDMAVESGRLRSDEIQLRGKRGSTQATSTTSKTTKTTSKRRTTTKGQGK